MSLLKEKLKNRKVTIGSWMQVGNPAVAEIMSTVGFDWIVVDMEHSTIDVSRAEELIRTIELSGCTPLVRVGENDTCLIKRVMDAGAYGIIVPMVNSKEDALRAVNAVKYPPTGKRGVGLARAQGYGANFDGYFNSINDESVVIVQIEHKDGVKNIDDIATVDGIDCIMIGPYDMSASYGVPGEFDHPSIIEAQDKVKKSAKDKGIALGTHVVWPPANGVEAKIDEGFNFIVYSADMIMLHHHFKEAAEEIKEMVKKCK